MKSDKMKIKVIIPFLSEKYVFHNYLYESWLNSNKEITEFHILFFNKNYLIESQINQLKDYNINHSFLNGNNFIESITQIVADSNTKFIAIANPHLILLPDWDNQIMNLFENKINIAGILGKTVDSNNLIIEAGFSYKKDEEFYGYGYLEKDDSPKYNYVAKLDFGSRFFLFTIKDIFIKQIDSFKGKYYELENFLWEFAKSLKKNNYELWYQPASKFVFNNSDLKIDSESPSIVINDNESNSFNVFVLISYSSHSQNNIEDILQTLNSDDSRIDYELINLEEVNFNILESKLKQKLTASERNYDYVIILKDSISIEKNYIKNFLQLQNYYKLDVAQPARKVGSFISNPILEKANGIKARRTDFITTNPIISISINYFNFLINKYGHKIFLYDELYLFEDEFESENVSLGIIDCLPIHYSGHFMIKDISFLTTRYIYLTQRIKENFIVKEVFV